MAAFTASATGNWNDGLTWGSVNSPGVAGTDYPGDTDSATINTGVTVTVPASTTSTVGTAPDNVTTYDLLMSGTAQLVINGTLNVKTNFDVTAGGIITVNGGGILNFNPSTRTGTKEYRLRLGNSGTGRLVLNNNATVTTEATDCFWYQQSGAASNAGQLDVNGVEGSRALIQRMRRSSSNVGWTVGLNITSAGKIEASHCTFDGCDDISCQFSGTFTIIWEWCTWVNSTGIQNITLPSSSVTKTLRYNTFDLNPNGSGGWNAGGIQPNECYFDDSWTAQGVSGFGSGWHVKRSDTSTNGPTPFYPAAGGALVTHEVLWLHSTGANPHWGTVNNGLTGSRTVSGPIYVYEGVDQEGDCTAPNNTDASVTKYTDLLYVPNPDGGQPGTWLSQLPNTGTVQYEHCTGVISGNSTFGVSVCEGSAPITSDKADHITSLKSNLAFPGKTDPSVGRGFLFQMQTNAGVTGNNPLTATEADYNWLSSANCTTAATVYDDTNGVITQTTPTAAHDIYNTDPDLLDKGRNMRTWAAWWGNRIGATGDSTITPGIDATAVNARLHLLQSHNGGLSVAVATNMMQLCVQYIRRGYIPRNTVGRGMGHDGLTAGMFGAFAPKLSNVTAAQNTASVTTTVGDGTLYWVITQSATTPDWDRIIEGKDHTGASVSAGMSGSQTVTGSGVQTVNTTSASLISGTNYYFHVAHTGAGTEAALDDYLKTSAEVTSAAFQSASGGASRASRNLIYRKRYRKELNLV